MHNVYPARVGIKIDGIWAWYRDCAQWRNKMKSGVPRRRICRSPRSLRRGNKGHTTANEGDNEGGGREMEVEEDTAKQWLRLFVVSNPISFFQFYRYIIPNRSNHYSNDWDLGVSTNHMRVAKWHCKLELHRIICYIQKIDVYLLVFPITWCTFSKWKAKH